MKKDITQLIGEKNNLLTIIGELDGHREPSGKLQRMVLCTCDCGTTTSLQLKDFRSGKTKSCGCNRPKENVVGNTYGKLKVLKDVDSYISHKKVKVRKVLCQCDCGGQKEIILGSLRAGKTTHCGCLKSPIIYPNRKLSPLDLDKVNQRDFGDWTIIEEISFNKDKRVVIAECKCGYRKTTTMRAMGRSGKSCSSCATQKILDKVTPEELERRAIRYTLRTRWTGMKRRCYNPEDKSYNRYGARGIAICEDWLSNFELFYNWAISNGFNKDLEIDRVNNDGNYEPSNCRWITRTENTRNQSNTILTKDIAFKIRNDWKDRKLSHIAKELGVSRTTIEAVRKGITWK